MNKEISSRLQNYRYQKGLSQEKLAEKLNISRSKVSSWESGRRDMSITDAILLVNLLDVSMDNLFNPIALNTNEFCEVAKRYFESKNASLDEKNRTIKELLNYRTNREYQEMINESK